MRELSAVLSHCDKLENLDDPQVREALEDEFAHLCEGKRYFPVSALRERCRALLSDPALEPASRVALHRTVADAILSTMAKSRLPAASQLGRRLEELICQLDVRDPARARLIRLRYALGLTWDEIAGLEPNILAGNNDAMEAQLMAELREAGLFQELLEEQNLQPRGDVTRLLEDVRDGKQPLGAVVEKVHEKLLRQAERLIRSEHGSISWQASDLRNEAVLRMPRLPQKAPVNHLELEALTRRIMRNILCDRGRHRVPGQSRYADELDEASAVSDEAVDDRLIRTDVLKVASQVLSELEQKDPQTAAMMRASLRGVDQKEIAKAYKTSLSTVKRRIKDVREMIRGRL